MWTHHVFSYVCEDAKGKELMSQTKEIVANVYDYFKNSTGVNGLKGISCATIKRLQIVLMTNSSRHFQFSFVVKSFFPETWWLNRKRQYFDYYFNNNNCYNRTLSTLVHITRTVIYHVTHSWLLRLKIVIHLVLKGV